MRDRHVDDGDVEHLEHRRQNDGDDERDRRTVLHEAAVEVAEVEAPS